VHGLIKTISHKTTQKKELTSDGVGEQKQKAIPETRGGLFIKKKRGGGSKKADEGEGKKRLRH